MQLSWEAEHQRQQTEESKVQQASTTTKLTTRTQFSWKQGFLTTHKNPTRQMTPMSKPQSTKTMANNHSTNTFMPWSRNGDAGPDDLTCRDATIQEVRGKTVSPMVLPGALLHVDPQTEVSSTILQ